MYPTQICLFSNKKKLFARTINRQQPKSMYIAALSFFFYFGKPKQQT